MPSCKDCQFSVFDEKWGDYKCKSLQMYIYGIAKVIECEYFKQKPTKKEEKPVTYVDRVKEVYNILKAEAWSATVFDEDFVVDLVGTVGFGLLKEHKLIIPSGKLVEDGPVLYKIVEN